jgi:hypothetical protein
MVFSRFKNGLSHVYLSGLVTELKLWTDPFIGIERCKVILDSLVKVGVDISFFHYDR